MHLNHRISLNHNHKCYAVGLATIHMNCSLLYIESRAEEYVEYSFVGQLLEAADIPRTHTLANENIKRGDVLDMAIIKQKPPERQKKTCRAKKNSTPRLGWEKAPRSRTWHSPREGRAVPRQSTTTPWGAFDISLFFPPYVPLPYGRGIQWSAPETSE